MYNQIFASGVKRHGSGIGRNSIGFYESLISRTSAEGRKSTDDPTIRMTLPFEIGKHMELKGPAVVSLDWLRDSAHHNEFMCADDYIIDEKHGEEYEVLSRGPCVYQYSTLAKFWDSNRIAGQGQRLSMDSLLNDTECENPTDATNVLNNDNILKRGSKAFVKEADAPVGTKRDRMELENSNGLLKATKYLKQPVATLPKDVRRASTQATQGHIYENVTIENLSMGQQQSTGPIPASSVPKAIPVAGPGQSEVNASEKSQAGVATVTKTSDPNKFEMYRVPSHSAWFRWDSIHDIEQRGNPEFFTTRAWVSPSKSARLYKEYRDFMITKFRENPIRKLTFTECHRYLSGDASAILRVFRFLERWGLLNYFPATESSPDELSTQDAYLPMFVSNNSAPSGLIINDTGSQGGVGDLYKFKQIGVTDGVAVARHGIDDKDEKDEKLLLYTRDRILSTKATAGLSEVNTILCSSIACKAQGVDCTNHYYRLKGSSLASESCWKDTVVCPECFRLGNLPSGFSSADYLKEVSTSGTPGQPASMEVDDWTDEETLLLLEALELKGDDDWNAVADYVGTKTPYQCVIHLLQMPIEDEFIDDYESNEPSANHTARGTALPEASKYGNGAEIRCQIEEPLPFMDTGNPVMSQIAFLAAIVGPRVAAAAAQAALSTLDEENPAVDLQLQRIIRHTNNEINGQEGDGLKENSMKDMNTLSHKQPDAHGGTDLQDAKVKVAAATALASAAVKAKLLAEKEERSIQRLVVEAIEKQIKKIELKLKYYEDIDKVKFCFSINSHS